jgi:hypothetical protein
LSTTQPHSLVLGLVPNVRGIYAALVGGSRDSWHGEYRTRRNVKQTQRHAPENQPGTDRSATSRSTWRAKPLTSYQVVLDLIASTTTSTGLKGYARLDTNTYQTKLKVTDAEINAVNLTRDDFHGEWN